MSKKENLQNSESIDCCPTCNRKFEEFTDYPKIYIDWAYVTDVDDVPDEIPHWYKENLLSRPTKGWNREIVPTPVMDYFSKNPNEDQFLHADSYIYYKPEHGENVSKHRFYARRYNWAPRVKELFENPAVASYLSFLKDVPGTEDIAPKTLFPGNWDKEFPDWLMYSIPGTESELFLGFTEDNDGEESFGNISVVVAVHGPMQGVVGPTLMEIFDLAQLQYQGKIN